VLLLTIEAQLENKKTDAIIMAVILRYILFILISVLR